MAETSPVVEPLIAAHDGRYVRAPGSQADTTTSADPPGGVTRSRTYGAGQAAALPAGWSAVATTAYAEPPGGSVTAGSGDGCCQAPYMVECARRNGVAWPAAVSAVTAGQPRSWQAAEPSLVNRRYPPAWPPSAPVWVRATFSWLVAQAARPPAADGLAGGDDGGPDAAGALARDGLADAAGALPGAGTLPHAASASPHAATTTVTANDRMAPPSGIRLSCREDTEPCVMTAGARGVRREPGAPIVRAGQPAAARTSRTDA